MKMPNLNYAPPNSWEEFESLMQGIYKKRWNDPKTSKNGRKGQKQHGVDIYGHINGSADYSGAQCKGKEQWPPQKLTYTSVKAEVAKAEKFTPKIADYEIATSARRDAKLQEKVRLFNIAQAKDGKLEVSIRFWEDILEEVDGDPDLAQFFQSQFDSHDVGVNAKEVSIETRIDNARKFVDERKVDTAFEQLSEIHDSEWTGLSKTLKFRVLSNLGRACATRGQKNESVSYFTEAYQMMPDDETAVTNMAWAYIQQEKYKEARNLLEPFIKDHPSNEKAYSNYIDASDDKNLAQLISFVPEYLRTISGIAQSLGNIAHIEGKLNEADKYYRQAIKSAKDKNSLAEAKFGLATVLKDKANSYKDVLGLRQISERSHKLLKESVKLSNEWWDSIKNTELARYMLDPALQMAYTLKVLDQQEDAKQFAYQILGIEPKNIQANLLLGLMASDNDDLEDAARFYGVVAKAGDEDARLMLAEIKSRQGKFSEVIDDLMKLRPKLKSDERKRQVMEMLSTEYMKLEQYELASKEIDDFLKNFPNDIRATIRKAALLGMTDSEEASVKTLKDIAASHTSSVRDDILFLADNLYEHGQYQEAADLYEQVLDTSVVTVWIKRLLDCYYHLGKSKEALEISSALRMRNGPIPFVTEVESYIYESIGDLEGARNVCVELLANYPDSPIIMLRLALMHLKLSELKKTDAILQRFKDGAGLNIRDAGLLVGLMSERGMKEKARETIYKLRKTNPGEKEIHSMYITYFFLRERDASPFEVKEVAVNTAVTVEGVFGQTTYLIHEDQTNYELHEFNVNHPTAKLFMGKVVGDEVELSSGTDKVKIIDIKHKYIYALHKSQELLQSAIIDSTGLRSIPFDPAKPEDAVKEINNNLSDRRRAVASIEKLYKDRTITIGAFALLLGRYTYEIFYGLQNGALNSTIFAATGNVGELETAAKTKNTIQLVVDETSLITMQVLGVGEKIVKQFGKLAITRATIDALQEHMRTMQDNRDDGIKTLTSVNGKIIADTVTPKAVEQYLSDLRTLLDFIDKNCEVLTVSKVLELDLDKIDKLKATLSESSAMAVLLATEKGKVLYSEDFPLRRVAEVDFSAQAVWTQPILMNLRDAGEITQEEYDAYLVELLKRNYRHTNFSLSTLELAAINAGWKLSEPLKSVLRSFSENDIDRLSLASIATNFLYSIWKKDTLNVQNRSAIANELVSQISKRTDSNQVLENLIKAVNIKFKLWPTATSDVITIIRRYI